MEEREKTSLSGGFETVSAAASGAVGGAPTLPFSESVSVHRLVLSAY
jgi:hypothetical protein